MQPITTSHALHIVGLALRTHNGEAMQTIPQHWQRWMQGQYSAQLPQRLNDDLYAVYTHFEHAGVDNAGLYTLVIGHAVDANQLRDVPLGLTHVSIPAGSQAVFDVPDHAPQRVPEAWQTIWSTSLPKAFIADYEHYAANGQIRIHIGLKA